VFSSENCIHIVEEHFPYKIRNRETANIVDSMERRKRSNKRDKISNNLIAIPGSPGSGKSTFLRISLKVKNTKNISTEKILLSLSLHLIVE
jgi:pantothenate kinase